MTDDRCFAFVDFHFASPLEKKTYADSSSRRTSWARQKNLGGILEPCFGYESNRSGAIFSVCQIYSISSFLFNTLKSTFFNVLKIGYREKTASHHMKQLFC